MTKNITLSLDAGLLTQAKKLAVEHETSLSQWVSELIQKALNQQSSYGRAKQHALKRLDRGLKLKPGRFTREELHAR